MSFQRVQQVRVAVPREAVWGALMTPDVWPVMDDAVQRCAPVAEDGTVLDLSLIHISEPTRQVR